MKVIVDQDACIGCNLCVEMCPDIYCMEDDKAMVYVPFISSDLEDLCKQAADSCPVNAINIE
jgi:ferredoxin